MTNLILHHILSSITTTIHGCSLVYHSPSLGIGKSRLAFKLEGVCCLISYSFVSCIDHQVLTYRGTKSNKFTTRTSFRLYPFKQHSFQIFFFNIPSCSSMPPISQALPVLARVLKGFFSLCESVPPPISFPQQLTISSPCLPDPAPPPPSYGYPRQLDRQIIHYPLSLHMAQPHVLDHRLGLHLLRREGHHRDYLFSNTPTPQRHSDVLDRPQYLGATPPVNYSQHHCVRRGNPRCLCTGVYVL